MSLYKIINQKASLINEQPFKLEKDLQNFCENNLKEIFDLEFVKSEFCLNNFRIDTLAYDSQIKIFVVIEFKKDKSFSVIDQGYAYLSLMLNNKADFILEYNECCANNLKRNDVDWSQSRVIFISSSFTTYQKESINFKDLPIELWEVKKYDNDTIHFIQIKSTNAVESIKTISKSNNNIANVSKEIKIYTEDDHKSFASEEIKELYEKLKLMIFNIGENINIKPTKIYIGFIAKTNFSDISLLKGSIKIWLNISIGELEDPKKLARDMSKTGHHGNGDYEIQISNDDNIEYILSLIKQSYKKNS